MLSWRRGCVKSAVTFSSIHRRPKIGTRSTKKPATSNILTILTIWVANTFIQHILIQYFFSRFGFCSKKTPKYIKYTICIDAEFKPSCVAITAPFATPTKRNENDNNDEHCRKRTVWVYPYVYSPFTIRLSREEGHGDS